MRNEYDLSRLEFKKDILRIYNLKSKGAEDDFVSLPPAECLSYVWDLTEEVFSLSGAYDVKSRLQRDAVNIIRKRG
jgi:hypothetical protein